MSDAIISFICTTFAYFKLSRSELSAITVTICGLFFANIPGEITLNGIDVWKTRGIDVQHGWPWPYLNRHIEGASVEQLLNSDNPGTCRLKGITPSVIWDLRIGVVLFRLDSLLADVVVGFLFVYIACKIAVIWRTSRASWCQLYLIELLSLLTIVSVALSYVKFQIEVRNSEQAALGKLFSQFHFSSDFSPPLPFRHSESIAGPHWLRQIIGDKMFRFRDRIDGLCFDCGRKFAWASPLAVRNFDQPEELRQIKYLRWLYYSGAWDYVDVKYFANPALISELRITWRDGRDLLYAANFPGLQSLTLDHYVDTPQFPDQDFLHLNLLTNLKSLDVEVDHAVDSWVLSMPIDSRITCISFRNSFLSDSSLAHLCKFRNIHSLGVDGQFSDNGISYLAGLSRLEVLLIQSSGVTDSCVDGLCACKNVRALNVDNTGITADALDKLSNLKKLERIELPYGLNATLSASNFRRKLPNCKVDCHQTPWFNLVDVLEPSRD